MYLSSRSLGGGGIFFFQTTAKFLSPPSVPEKQLKIDCCWVPVGENCAVVKMLLVLGNTCCSYAIFFSLLSLSLLVPSYLSYLPNLYQLHQLNWNILNREKKNSVKEWHLTYCIMACQAGPRIICDSLFGKHNQKYEKVCNTSDIFL